MKINKKIFTLIAGLALVLTGCQEDDFGKKYEPAKVGDQIAFGGYAGYSPKGRTVYGDKVDGTDGSDGYTEVKWYQGDMVRIYCAEAINGTSVKDANKQHIGYYTDYVVAGDGAIDGVNNKPTGDGKNETTHEASLVLPSGETEGLCWGSTGNHTFYGVYPAPAQLNATGADQESQLAAGSLELVGNTLKGFLPNKQTPLGTTKYTTSSINNGQNTHYTIQPSMRYAYMVAKSQASPSNGGVTLTFNPIVTALEITLQNNTENIVDGTPKEFNIDNLEMISITANKPICGSFETNLDNLENTLKNSDATNNTISIPVPKNNSNNIILKKGDKITVTVFMIMDDTDSDIVKDGGLKEFTASLLVGANTKRASLSKVNNATIVEVKKKNFINDIPLNIGTVTNTPVVDPMTPANWVKFIPDQIDNTPNKIGNLSIPGAGGAASKSIYDAGDYVSAQQSLSISDLWNQGVRCFEFGVDRNSSLGREFIYCNLVNTNVTLKSAMDQVSQKILENPEEFAIVIVTYQEKLTSEWDRNAGDNGFAGNFNSWWAGYTYTATVNGETKTLGHSNKKQLSATTTVAEARGNIFMICRPVSIGLDGGWHTGVSKVNYNSTNGPYTVVLGWGDHADQWYVRGFGTAFTVNPSGKNILWDKSNPTSGTVNRYFYASQNEESVKTVGKISNYNPSFLYKYSYGRAITYASLTTNAYVQDWRRVMPTAEIQEQYGITGLPAQGKGSAGDTYYYNWSPSSNEKWNDITNALDVALGSTKEANLYINSLCGYFIDGEIELSYLPRATFQRMNEERKNFWGTSYRTIYAIDDKYQSITDVNGDNAPYAWNTGWGPYHIQGGYKGNIGDFAHWVNNKFYNHLLTLQANGKLNKSGGTGIILMDRVSNNPETDAAGYYIPRIILSNNLYNSDLEQSRSRNNGDIIVKILE